MESSLKTYPNSNAALALLMIIRDFAKDLYAFKQRSSDPNLVRELLDFARYHRGHQQWLRDPMPGNLPFNFRNDTTAVARNLIQRVLFDEPNSVLIEVRAPLRQIESSVFAATNEAWIAWQYSRLRLISDLVLPAGCTATVEAITYERSAIVICKKGQCAKQHTVNIPTFGGFTYGDLFDNFQKAFSEVKKELQELLNKESTWPPEREILEAEKGFVLWMASLVKCRLNPLTTEILSRNRELFLESILKDN